MAAYFNTLEHSCKNQGCMYGGFGAVYMPRLYTEGTIVACDRLLAQAKQETEADARGFGYAKHVLGTYDLFLRPDLEGTAAKRAKVAARCDEGLTMTQKMIADGLVSKKATAFYESGRQAVALDLTALPIGGFALRDPCDYAATRVFCTASAHENVRVGSWYLRQSPHRTARLQYRLCCAPGGVLDSLRLRIHMPKLQGATGQIALLIDDTRHVLLDAPGTDGVELFDGTPHIGGRTSCVLEIVRFNPTPAEASFLGEIHIEGEVVPAE